jgi:hypothetical protein
MENIYDLKLHESLKIVGSGIDTEITRVPGGWIYNILTYVKLDDYWKSTPVFVPYNNEYQTI